MSVLLIAGPICTLDASHAALGLSHWLCTARSVKVMEKTGQTDRRTDGRTDGRESVTLNFPLDAASVLTWHRSCAVKWRTNSRTLLLRCSIEFAFACITKIRTLTACFLTNDGDWLAEIEWTTKKVVQFRLLLTSVWLKAYSIGTNLRKRPRNNFFC